MSQPTVLPSETGDTSNAPPVSGFAGLRQNGFALALITWTFFVWGGRLRNISADGVAFERSEVWRPFLIASFLGMALVAMVLLCLLLRSSEERFERRQRWFQQSITVLAGFGILVWLVRGADIAFGGHEVGFIIVHSALAAMTIGLGLGVIWAQRSWGPGR